MAGFELIDNKEQESVNEVFENGGGILFRHGFDGVRKFYKVKEFEEKFAKRLNVDYARAVTSGTVALKVALKACGVGPGDEVITQCHTFVATVEAILDVGATPVITEIDKSLNMDVNDLKDKITDKTKAIIPVHMLGVPCNMYAITQFYIKHNIKIIEDTAQALGGSIEGVPLGTIGHIGCFSFDFGKTITTGEGGMCITDNKKLYDKIKQYTDHGHVDNPDVPRYEDDFGTVGFNYNIMELQGAVGVEQLKKLDYILKKQEENKTKLKGFLLDCTQPIEFRRIPDPMGEIHDSLVFFVEDKIKVKQIRDALFKAGFGTKNLPDGLKWHFAGEWNHIFKKDEWIKSRKILERAVAIPINVKMNDKQINKIVKVITNNIK